MNLENAISPEWFGVAKAVSYLLGAACCLFCHWMGFKAGKIRGRVEEESQAAEEWLERFRKYALGCDRLDVMTDVDKLAARKGVRAHVEKCQLCGEPHIVYDDPSHTCLEEPAQTKSVLGTPLVPGPDAKDFTKASNCKVCGREDCLWAGETHLTACECFKQGDRP